MKILITGAKGFVGRNLVEKLKNRGYTNIYEFDLDNDPATLVGLTKDCDFIFHLAGINRPQDDSEFNIGNRDFTQRLLKLLSEAGNTCPILFSSSIQAARDNAYGRSKKAAEDELFAYAETTDAKVLIYRLPNLFGKWCRPNYNSVVATFCYQLARNKDITVNDPTTGLTLSYIDDVIDDFISAMEGHEKYDGKYCCVSKNYQITLGELANKLINFSSSQKTSIMSSLSELDYALYSTFISYLPVIYDLDKKVDN